MQKKFLRTSVLTLVLGVFHMNEIHAMATRSDFDEHTKALAKLQTLTVRDTEECEARSALGGRGPTPGDILCSWKSQRTGQEHKRVVDLPSEFGTEDTFSCTTVGSSCWGCTKLLVLHMEAYERLLKCENQLYQSDKMSYQSYRPTYKLDGCGSTYSQPGVEAARPENEVADFPKLCTTPLKIPAHWPTLTYECRWTGQTHQMDRTDSPSNELRELESLPSSWSGCDLCTAAYDRIAQMKEMESRTQRLQEFQIAAKKRSEEAAIRSRSDESAWNAQCPTPSQRWTTPPGTTHYAPSPHIASGHGATRTALAMLMDAEPAQDHDY